MTDCDRYAASGLSLEEVNPKIAIPACEEAVRSYPNSSRLVFELGRSYSRNGDFTAALAQFRKPVEQGYAPALNSIGAMYASGTGVPKDDVEAVNWYRQSAERGYNVAQVNLGFMYENGLGVPQDYANALQWYHLAADQGSALAQDSVGYFYTKGMGVKKDYSEAIVWFRKAAEQGMAGAQYNLAVMYEKGLGVPEDRAQALRWYGKSAEQGDEKAKKALLDFALEDGALPDTGKLSPPVISRAAATSDTASSSASMPAAEKAVIDAVEDARRTYATASNEMQKGGARGARQKSVCAAIPDRKAHMWIGNVSTISSNSEGKGVLSVTIAPGVQVKTFNNAFSDIRDHTLIEPSTSLFQKASSLDVGQTVRFSGNFFDSSVDCIEEASFTLEGSVTEPEFIMQFSNVTPLDQGTVGCSAVTDSTERLTCFYKSAENPGRESPNAASSETVRPSQEGPGDQLLSHTTSKSEGMILTVGRRVYSSGSGYIRQSLSVKNSAQETSDVTIECGFFNKEELIATQDAYVLRIAAGSTGYNTIMVSSDIAADRVECRIADIHPQHD